MPDALDLLVEIGTEELPPKDLQRLAEAFKDEMSNGLKAAGLSHKGVIAYATPRRLAVCVEDLLTRQPERKVERRGPAINKAFDDGGNPTRAAQGFASSCGVQIEQLDKLQTEKGSWLVFRSVGGGKPTSTLIAPMVGDALGKLPTSRRMRWGHGEEQFVRPVQWVVILFGEEGIDAEILGLPTSTSTRGHRFHHPDPIRLQSARDYAKLLRDKGYVVADFQKRKQIIRESLQQAGVEAGGTTMIDEELLDEVTGMVEWPVPVIGAFDDEFLELPTRALIATMQGHQRYFPVMDSGGDLLPRFVTIANINSTNPAAVQKGNERVIRPRLKDAAFFYGNDIKKPLASRISHLEGVVFHEKLGSLADKSQRVSVLARQVAVALNGSPCEVNHAARSGLLAKCDLVSEMVGEFPELQGYMGHQYATVSGEPAEVALAIEESYLPRFAADQIPTGLVGHAVALADKLDTLAGIFAVGLQPSGDKDPFALRRTALGILRIIIEGKFDVDLRHLLTAAVEGLPRDRQSFVELDALFDFAMDRLRGYFSSRGILPDVFASVLSLRPSHPFDFARRVYAVNEFRKHPAAKRLATANKRIQNILRQADCDVPPEIDNALLREDAESVLARELVQIGPLISEMLGRGDYRQAMTRLADLSECIDTFFDTVKVMADVEEVKQNRLALISHVGELFLQTADISELQM